MTGLIRTSILLALAFTFVGAAAFGDGFATDSSGRLYRVLPGKKTFEKVGTVVVTKGEGKAATTYTPTLTDIAMSDLHGLYGISFSELYKIDMRDPSKSKHIGSLGGFSGFNALAFDEAGTLFAMGGDTLYRVDLKTGAARTVGKIGSGGYSDGDLAFIDGVLYGTLARSDGSHLVRIDPKTGKGVDVGVIRRVAPAEAPEKPKEGTGRTPRRAPKDAGGAIRGTPIHSVWGLIWDGRSTWALTSDGHVLKIDPKTAHATPQFRAPVDFYGACPALRL